MCDLGVNKKAYKRVLLLFGQILVSYVPQAVALVDFGWLLHFYTMLILLLKKLKNNLLQISVMHKAILKSLL